MILKLPNWYDDVFVLWNSSPESKSAMKYNYICITKLFDWAQLLQSWNNMEQTMIFFYIFKFFPNIFVCKMQGRLVCSHAAHKDIPENG